MQLRPIASVRALAHKALSHGATRRSFSRIEWDVGAHCSQPVCIEVVGRGDLENYRSAVNPGFLIVEISGLPCRKCPDCLRVRAARWKARALTETSRVSRTWFCTLTMKPQLQHKVFMQELAIKRSKGWLDSDFDNEQDEFLLRCQGGLKLVTKFWKRVRKPMKGEEPVRLKYLVTAERHISGLPHYHALVHECAGSVTYRRLASRWKEYGFFHGRLVVDNKKAASYCTKYIAKDMLCRVRASQRYGHLLSVPSELDLSVWADVFRQKTLSKAHQHIEED